MFSAELKKGSTEMLVLSLLEGRPRHGYEIGKLIEARSGGRLTFALPTLYPTLLRLENRGWIKGRWVEKAGQRERCFYRLTADGRRVLAAAAEDVGRVRRGHQGRDGRRRCVTGPPSCGAGCGCRTSRPSASHASCGSWRRSSKISIATRSARGASRGRRRRPGRAARFGTGTA